MNDRHADRFKSRHRMAVAQTIGTSHFKSNGHSAHERMQGVMHLPDQLPFGIRTREWLRRSFIAQGWEQIVVNKSVDSVTMPKWVASAILVAILGFGVSSWWRSSDQRDMLIELRTELRLSKEREAEKMIELKNQANLNKVYLDNVTNQVNTIKGMLSQQQINTVEGKRDN